MIYKKSLLAEILENSNIELLVKLVVSKMP